jgi:uncharacterized protein YjbJ (UPF0337 family)
MQELINKLMTEVGLTNEQATKAFSTVVGHVKGMLPAAFGSTIDNMLAPKAEGAEPSVMSKAADMAGDAKNKLTDMAGDAKEKMENIADAAKEKLSAFTSEENLDALKDKAEDAINKLKGFFGGKKED